MELCSTPRTFSNLPNHKLHISNQLNLKPSLLLKKSPKCRFNPGLFYRMGSSIRSTSEGSSSFTSVKETEGYELYVPPKIEKEDDEPVQNVALIEDSKKDEKTDPYADLIYQPPKDEEEDNGAVQTESPIEDPIKDENVAPIEDSKKDEETDPYADLIYQPPKAEEKDNGAVQTESPIEDPIKDEKADPYASPPKVEEKDNEVVQTELLTQDPIKDEKTDPYVSPPKVEEKDNGAVQTESPLEDPIKDEKTDPYASSPEVEEKDDGALQTVSPTEDYEPPKAEEKGDGAVQTEAPTAASPKVEEKDDASFQTEAPVEDPLVESQLPEFLDKLNIKFDPEDSSSIYLFGGVAVVALWLTTVVVGTIDSIPLIPKLLQVVGLGYTLWFSTRYLLFKKNRDELAAKIEALKQEVLGGSNE